MEGVSLVVGPDFARLFTLFLIVVIVITIVRAARLAWRLSSLAREAASLDRALAGAEPDIARRTLRTADARFRYLWQQSQAGAIATRGLAQLTLLATAFATVVTIYPEFAWATNETSLTAAAAAYQAGRILANRLAAGLLVCALLWVVSIAVDARLRRLMAEWEYRHALARNAIARE